jgi:eukaryotic-like serine/threonine-protein kinase
VNDEQLVLGGRYLVGDVIGQGGMATVYQGRDLRLGRPIAVKVLRPDLARDPTFHSRFRREAQAAAGLNAPSVVAVYDTGEDEIDGQTTPYIVMELVPGQTVRDLLRSGQKLMPRRSLEIVDGVLSALDYSHRNGIVHRDVKPANVMITTDGSVKVMDFGIARAVADASSTITQTAAVLGTAQYLSPEQAQGGTVDARSDVYSAGCLLYELLSGRPPFIGDSAVAVAYQHVREMPPPPSSFAAEVPPDADAIVMKALAKNPDNRYQSASEMREDIGRALAGIPVTAPPVLTEATTTQLSAVTTTLPAAPTTPPSRGRRAGRYVLLGVIVLAVVAVLGFAAYALFGAGSQKVVVPNVKGLSLTAATGKIQDAGLVVDQVTPTASDLPKNTVISQNPPANAQVSKGSAVDLTVSSGPAQVPVPNVVNFDQATATQRIIDAGLQVAAIKSRNSDQPAGTVVAVQPAEGTMVDTGSSVTLWVSTGKVSVPDVVGDTLAQAQATLIQAGFDPQPIYQQDGTVPDGTVLAQSPAAGQARPLGSTVTITVAQAPPSPSPTSTSGSPSPSPSTS